jgi:hypothetical protein
VEQTVSPFGRERGSLRLFGELCIVRRTCGTWRGSRQRFGFGNFRRVFWIAEAIRWFGLGIVGE